MKLLGLLPLALLLNACQGVALLDPKGPVGAQERDLILMAVGLALLVIIPVLFMVVWFATHYRESNKKATYKPHWEGTVQVETLVWLIPILIIGVLSYLTWVKTTDLDPYKPLPSAERPLHVQVVSLDWNWLFIYPDYGVATLNTLTIPQGVPVTFDLTSATVMTSFFIPDLGSQMYVMAGMTTHLNLLADHPGTFMGHNMEFSGVGYEAMRFPTNSLTKDKFDEWMKAAKSSPATLNLDQFTKLNTPRAGLPATTYASVEPDLFGHVLNLFGGMMGKGTMMGMTGGAMTGDAMKASDSAMPMGQPGDSMKMTESTMPTATSK